MCAGIADPQMQRRRPPKPQLAGLFGTRISRPFLALLVVGARIPVFFVGTVLGGFFGRIRVRMRRVDANMATVEEGSSIHPAHTIFF